jgi:hypothetical protein
MFSSVSGEKSLHFVTAPSFLANVLFLMFSCTLRRKVVRKERKRPIADIKVAKLCGSRKTEKYDTTVSVASYLRLCGVV